jgi:PAS domain-containing protein
MPPAATALDPNGELRLRAQAQLRSDRGSPPARSTAEALAVLYRLAASPATAGDALALLHELQVHQVELELQQEELQRTQIELEQALQRQIERLERAPLGCLSLDASGRITELNSAAAHLLGAAVAALWGRTLSSLLTPSGAQALQALLLQVGAAGPAPAEVCVLELLPSSGQASQLLHASASADQPPGHWLLALLAPPETALQSPRR